MLVLKIIESLIYLHIDGVNVYYDKINSSVTFTYSKQYVSNHLEIYVIECMIFLVHYHGYDAIYHVSLVFKRFDSFI